MKTTNMVMRTILLFGSYIFLLSGCATLNDTVAGTPWRAYSGPQMPSDKVVIIKTSGIRDFFREAYVLKINNETVGNVGGYIEALPGSQTLDVSISERWDAPGTIIGKLTEKKAKGSITLEAQAGHIYIVDGKIVDGQAAIWIEDEKTRQIIAGRKP